MKKWIFGLIAFFTLGAVAWGATYTKWIDGTLKNPISQQVIEINDYMRIYKHQINFASQTLDAGNADVAEVLLLPKNSMILKSWIRVVTACPANSTVDLGYGSDVDYFGNGLKLNATGIVKVATAGTVTWDPGSIADGNEESVTITVAGAATGDTVKFVFTAGLTNLALSGIVSGNLVYATLGNWTGQAVDLASGTLTAFVNKAPFDGVPLLFTASDTIDVKATIDFDASGDTNISSGVIEINALVMSTSQSGFPQ